MTSSIQQHRKQTRPRISAHNATFAKVVVGPKAQSFTVHLDLLVYHSPFFRAALKGSFKEADEKLVTLSDTKTDIFELFVHWLYYQRFPTDVDSPQLLALYCTGQDISDQWGMLVGLYLFSDRYDVPELKRLCLDTTFQFFVDEDILPDLALAKVVFENLEAHQDPLCRLWVDMHCYWCDSDAWALQDVQGLPSTFLTKVLGHYAEFAFGGRDQIGMPELCNYHDHATREEREACEGKREKADQAREILMD